MDLQTVMQNAMKAKRAEEMLTSPQLTLGELILKIEAVADKSLSVTYDVEGYYPHGVDSWRGSYCELAIGFTNDETSQPTVAEFLEGLKFAVGNTYQGYKGGEFLMGRTTPVWVANYGDSSGFKANDELHCQAVTDVKVTADAVVIESRLIDY